MNWKFSSCPGTWGIEDSTNPANTPWPVVLDQISAIGFEALELGPYGYLPADTVFLTESLNQRNLQIVAGTLYDDLVSEEAFDRILEKTHEVCRILSTVPKAPSIRNQNQPPPYYVIIDAVKPEREQWPRSRKAPGLSPQLQRQMVSHIKEIAKITSEEYGVRSVIHHHAGGYIDYADEIDLVLSEVTHDEAGLCFDTGHAYYAGIDPVGGIRKYQSRIDYLHFKDIDRAVFDVVVDQTVGFYEACFQRLMVPIGEGILDYAAIKNAIRDINYRGWITLEQDRHPMDTSDVAECINKSLRHLEDLGF